MTSVSVSNYLIQNFKDEKIIIKALTKDKNIKDWREKNTLKRNRKIYIPSM